MKIIPEQQALYEKAMEAGQQLFVLLQPITQEEKDLLYEEMRDCGPDNDDITTAFGIFEARALDEEMEAEE